MQENCRRTANSEQRTKGRGMGMGIGAETADAGLGLGLKQICVQNHTPKGKREGGTVSSHPLPSYE